MSPSHQASDQPPGMGRCRVGDVRATSITPAQPASPDRNNAPFCPSGDRGHCVCWLPPETRGTDRPSERQDCLGQPPQPQGCHPTRHNKPRAGKRTAALEEQGTSETPDFETPRSQGQDRKQGLGGKLDHSELRAHFKGPWDRTSKTLQPKRLSGKLVVKSRERGVRMWVQNSVWDISWLSELGQNYR